MSLSSVRTKIAPVRLVESPPPRRLSRQLPSAHTSCLSLASDLRLRPAGNKMLGVSKLRQPYRLRPLRPGRLEVIAAKGVATRLEIRLRLTAINTFAYRVRLVPPNAAVRNVVDLPGGRPRPAGPLARAPTCLTVGHRVISCRQRLLRKGPLGVLGPSVMVAVDVASLPIRRRLAGPVARQTVL